MAEQAKKKHTVRNVILIVLAAIIVGIGVTLVILSLGSSNALEGEWQVASVMTGNPTKSKENVVYDLVDADATEALYANFDKKAKTLTVYDKTEDGKVNEVYFKMPYYGLSITPERFIKTKSSVFSGKWNTWSVRHTYKKSDDYLSIYFSGVYSGEKTETLQTEVNKYEKGVITELCLIKADYNYAENVKLDEVKSGATYGNLKIKEIKKAENSRENGIVYEGVMNVMGEDEEFVIGKDDDGRYFMLSTYTDSYHTFYIKNRLILKADANQFVYRDADTSTTTSDGKTDVDSSGILYISKYAKK